MSPATATKPGQIVKQELTVEQAEAQWIRADDRIAREKARQEEAAAILQVHLAKKRGVKRYKRVELVTASPSRVMDQPKVRAFLGKKLDRFMKWTDPQPRIARVRAEE